MRGFSRGFGILPNKQNLSASRRRKRADNSIIRRLSQEDTLEGDSNSIVNQKELPDNPYNWKDSSIVGIEQQVIFFNTHEAIVEDSVFERVRNSGQTNAAPQRQSDRACSLDWCTMRTVGVNYISLLAKVSTTRKTITAVQNIKAIREAVWRNHPRKIFEAVRRI